MCGPSRPRPRCRMATIQPHRRVTRGSTLHQWREHAFAHEIVFVALAALTYFGVRNLTVGAAAEAL